MTNDEKAIARGMVRVALYHGLPKNEWMAKVVPEVEEHLGTPLTEEVIDRIHQAFKDEMPPQMTIEEVCLPQGRSPLIEQLAENLAIYAGDMDDKKHASCMIQSGYRCRSERVPGRLRCEFEVADIGAEPQSDA